MRGLRAAYLAVAVVLLLILPISGENATMMLALFVAVDLAAAALLLRPVAAAPSGVFAIAGDAANVVLLRRTVPALRSRRPTATIEAQVMWRQAAERHRQRREIPRLTLRQ